MTKNKKLRFFVLILGLAATATAWSQADRSVATENVQAPKITIGPGDMLEVRVFDTPELSATARVNQSGVVTLSVLGDVAVADLNADGAARRIEAALRTRGILLDPHVTVSIAEYATQGATVLGEVRTPGMYPTLGSRRLLDMIALVPNAAAMAEQKNPVILPGDTILVGKAGILYVLGDVNRAGGFLIDNNEHLSLIQALSLAGGWNKTAALSKVRLVRRVAEGRKELQIDLKQVIEGRQADVRVEDGDILYVPSSTGKTLVYKGIDAAIAAAQTAVVYVAAN